MCGRYGFSRRQIEKVSKKMGLEIDGAIAQLLEGYRKQNHAPTTPGPVVRSAGRFVEMLPWGFMSAAFPGRPPHLLINARSETVAKKASFREAWRHRRCLVIADYFYEWNQETPKGEPKQPWRFSRADDEPMVIAGIWSPVSLKGGAQTDGYAVLTTDAAPTVAALHDRMPVILHERDWRRWINESTPHEELEALQRSYDGPMTAVPVTTALNKASYQGPVEEVELGSEPAKPAQGELF